MAARSIVRSLLIVAAVAVTLASVRNVFLEDDEARAIAAKVACGDEGCAGPGPTRVERTPLAEHIEHVTRGGRTVAVVCTRRAWLVGPYECVRE